jgi:hypothetical protein
LFLKPASDVSKSKWRQRVLVGDRRSGVLPDVREEVALPSASHLEAHQDRKVRHYECGGLA